MRDLKPTSLVIPRPRRLFDQDKTLLYWDSGDSCDQYPCGQIIEHSAGQQRGLDRHRHSDHLDSPPRPSHHRRRREMLDIRLDHRPLYFPPPSSHSSLKDQHGVDVKGYLDAASVINRISDASARLPDLIPLRVPALQQQQQQQRPGSDLTPPSLANVAPFDRLSDFPGMLDPVAVSNGISSVLRAHHDAAAAAAATTIASAFDSPYHHHHGEAASSKSNRHHHQHHPHPHHHHHHRHSHHSAAAAAHRPPIAPPSQISTESSLPSLSPSSPPPLSSPLPRSCHHRLGQRSSQPEHRHHHHHDHHDHQRRRSSASPELPWRPFQSNHEPHHHALLAAPFHDQTFRGAESLRGELGADLSDRIFHAALPPLPWHLSPSLQMAMSGDGSASSNVLKFSPFSSLMESASAMAHRIDPLLFPAPGFMYPHSAHAILPGLKDTFCRASSPRVDLRSSPGKELPTKVKKQNRVKDRQEVTSVLEADTATSDHLLNIKKTASTQTQTQLSSFPNDGLPPPPYHTTHDTIKLDRLNTSVAPLHTPPTFHHHHHIPPPPPFTHGGFHQGTLPLPPPPPPPPLPLISTHPSSSITSSSASPSSPTSVSTSTSSPATLAAAATHKSKIPKAPPLLYLNRSPPPQYATVARSPVDVQHAPLNLSLSSSHAPPPSSPTTPTHPSVISCGSVAPPMDHMAPDQGGALDRDVLYGHKKFWSNRPKDADQDPISQDEAIEEHFRRSLGQIYAEASSPKQSKKTAQASQTPAFITSSSSPPPPPPPSLPSLPSLSSADSPSSEAEGVSITGSVDDHFARALGNQMWTAIKAKSEPSTPETCPDTVDAHFAKALGASMWKRIQANVEDVEPDLTQEHQPLHHHLHHQQQQQQQHQQQQQQQNQHRTSSSSSSPIHSQVAT